MAFQKRSHKVKSNAEATFLKHFCAEWEFLNSYAENLPMEISTNLNVNHSLKNSRTKALVCSIV